jgi:GNAT superfamily N-acetyltransferase
MPHVSLPLTPEQFQQLPRNAGYSYSYHDGVAHMTPRAVYYRARVELNGLADEPTAWPLRPARPEDAPELTRLFAAAFDGVQPFGSLDPEEREQAAGDALHQTLSGGDGPWLDFASFVACDDDGRAVGAVLITLVPPLRPDGEDLFVWRGHPPADAVEQCAGRPHLTWIFVAPRKAGLGLGTALLHAAAARLRARGFTELVSTFILGNDSSMMWHWRHGFRLI